MSGIKPGFAVIYRWRILPEKEEFFQQAWAQVTRLIKDERGGLGSRLHKADDGTWVAYAQWPSKVAWENSQKAGPVDETASAQMSRAIQESLAPILLELVEDWLER